MQIKRLLSSSVVLTVLFLFITLPAEGQTPLQAENGMVASAEINASEVGVEVMKQGGNGVDAAVATGFALAVTYPAAGNVGGGGFMVIRFPDGNSTTIDFRERAPKEAYRDMYLDEDGEPIDTLSRRGHLASGTPGTVAGLKKAHEQYGELPWSELVQPAIDLAADGFELSQGEARSLNNMQENFLRYESTGRYFVKSDTSRFERGERFVQSDLADVLRRVRDEGRAGFYEGETADLIVDEMQRGNGIITHEDLQAYDAEEREPIITYYRGHRVIGMGPPSSGGVAIAQLLHAMEEHDIEGKGFGSGETIHLMGEAMRRVYADRAKWLGDKDFVDVPIEGLTSPSYIAERMENFDPQRVTSSDEIDHGDPMAFESEETTHYSTVDEDGLSVSVTTTLNSSYGSRVVVDGAGFFMNNEMDDFSVKPGHPNIYGLVGAEANAIEAEKRMLSSMSPTIVENPQGELLLSIGSPGGATIITQVFQFIMNVVDHGMNIQKAIAVPRVHHQWLPDELRYERYGMPADVKDNLRQKGWELAPRTSWGRASGIMVVYDTDDDQPERVYHAGSDPRSENAAEGY